MALTGCNFCTSAKDAFLTVMSNPVRYALVEGLGGLFIEVGTWAIALTSTYIGYLVVTKRPEIMEKLVGTTFPCIVSSSLFFYLRLSRYSLCVLIPSELSL